MSQAGLTARNIEKRAVAPVSVEENDSPDPTECETAGNIVEHPQHCVIRKPNRARRPGVLVRFRIWQCGRNPYIEFIAESVDDCAGSLAGNDVIDGQREMRPMLFDRADGHDHCRVGAQQPACVRSTQRFKESSHLVSVARNAAHAVFDNCATAGARLPTITPWNFGVGSQPISRH
jgi:hypothetical protein